MGSGPLEQQVGTPIDNNLIALLVTNQTDKVISKIESEGETFMSQRLNFRGDTFLHYACAKNNSKLVEYSIKKYPSLLTQKNDIG